MTYAERIIEQVKAKNAEQPEFIQAATEILGTLQPALDAHPEFEEAALLERIIEPERIIQFRVPWVDDYGKVQVNRGFRVEYQLRHRPLQGRPALPPHRHRSVMLKFLGFEQIFKNALTTLPMGGGKGGSDFDPKGKSDAEVMRFCQSFMNELSRHIGPNTDVPAGDLGVGGREVGYMFGQYKRLRNEWTGVLTGKGLSFGGSLARTEATGYGLVLLRRRVPEVATATPSRARTSWSHGSGNVAIYAVQKVSAAGRQGSWPCSDSNGYVEDPNGIDVPGASSTCTTRSRSRPCIKDVSLSACTSTSAPTPPGTRATARGVWQRPVRHRTALRHPRTTLHLDESARSPGGQRRARWSSRARTCPPRPDAIEVPARKTAWPVRARPRRPTPVAWPVSGLEMSQNSRRT